MNNHYWMDNFYKLYQNGTKKEKAPLGYIDYFKAREFVLKEREQAVKEVIGEVMMLDERTSRGNFTHILISKDKLNKLKAKYN